MSVALAAAPLFVSSTKTSYVVARWTDYVGTTLFCGALAFVAMLWPAGASVPAARRVLATSWLLGLVSTLAAIGLDGAWIGSQPPSAALRWSVIRASLELDFGRQWAVKAMLWLLAGVVLADLLRRGARAATSLSWRVGALAVVVAMLRVIGLTGHSQEAPDSTVAQLADLVHLSAMSLWLGGLAIVLVAVLPRGRPDELRSVLPRYSTLAMLAVSAVIASGTVLAWQLLGGIDALVDTTYGRLLLTKLSLLAVILAAAWASKTWVEHRLDFAVVLRGDRSVIRPAVYSIAVETALVLLVLIVASFLVTANPAQ
jgi:copper transport protein